MEPKAIQQLGFLPAVLVAVVTRGTRPVTSSRSRTFVTSGVKTVSTTATTAATTTAATNVISLERPQPPTRPQGSARRTATRPRKRGR